MRSSVAIAAMLLAIWVLAWGSASWANVASGVVVVVGLLIVVPDARRPGRRLVVRPVPLVRLVVRYLRDVVVANVAAHPRGAARRVPACRPPSCGCRWPAARPRH